MCPRRYTTEQEPSGKIVYIKKKPVCQICRATKLSTKAKEISKDKSKYQQDYKSIKAKEEEKEKGRMAEVASDSMAETKTFHPSTNKFRAKLTK